MVKKRYKSIILFFVLFIAAVCILLFVKSKNLDVQPTSKVLTKPKSTSGEEIVWEVYENKHIYFKHPENKRVHDIFGGPAEESKTFYLYGKTGSIIMEISIFSIPKDTNEVFDGEFSTKVLAERSRTNKISKDGEEGVLSIQEISSNDLLGHYYDFNGNYSSPSGVGAGFVTDNSCSKYRAAFLKSRAEIMTVIYCLEEPYRTIFDTIRLK